MAKPKGKEISRLNDRFPTMIVTRESFHFASTHHIDNLTVGLVGFGNIRFELERTFSAVQILLLMYASMR